MALLPLAPRGVPGKEAAEVVSARRGPVGHHLVGSWIVTPGGGRGQGPFAVTEARPPLI